MALLGLTLNRKNPEFTIEDFLFWMPSHTNFMNTSEGQKYFEKLYPIANNKIFKSVWGTDWEYAMSLCIAHYCYIISKRASTPSGPTLSEIAGGGVTTGVISTASIGSFSKSYDLSNTMLDTQDAMFWNQSSYGAELMALLKTKAVPSVFVVTSGPIVSPNPVTKKGESNEE